MIKKIIVTTSWDDGHSSDIKLSELLKKYEVKGTFYISPGNREFKKEELLTNIEIIKLSRNFEIGCHTMTHPRLTRIIEHEALNEIIDSKKYLEKLINKEIRCFCYPGGKYNKRIIALVEKAGFYYARTIERFEFNLTENLLFSGTTTEAYRNSLLTLPRDFLKILKFSRFNLMESFKNLNWEYLAKKTFDHVQKNGNVFHLWGHSWVIEKNNDWKRIDRVLSYISKKENVNYCTNSEAADMFK